MSATRCPEAGRSSLRSLRLILMVALLGAAATVARAASPISFLPPVSYTMTGASGITAADLDGDGNLDLIVGDVFHWQSIMAATLIPSIPLALLYNSFLDRFIKGFTGGAFR